MAAPIITLHPDDVTALSDTALAAEHARLLPIAARLTTLRHAQRKVVLKRLAALQTRLTLLGPSVLTAPIVTRLTTLAQQLSQAETTQQMSAYWQQAARHIARLEQAAPGAKGPLIVSQALDQCYTPLCLDGVLPFDFVQIARPRLLAHWQAWLQTYYTQFNPSKFKAYAGEAHWLALWQALRVATHASAVQTALDALAHEVNRWPVGWWQPHHRQEKACLQQGLRQLQRVLDKHVPQQPQQADSALALLQVQRSLAHIEALQRERRQCLADKANTLHQQHQHAFKQHVYLQVTQLPGGNPLRQWVLRKDAQLRQLGKQIPASEADWPKHKARYQAWWSAMAQTAGERAIAPRQSGWHALHHCIVQAGDTLVNQGQLTWTFADSHRPGILRRLDQLVAPYQAQAAQGGVNERYHQLLALRQQLIACPTSQAAANHIASTIDAIEQSHQQASLAYNIVFWRKSSRSASALRALLVDSQAQGHLPAPKAPAPSPVLTAITGLQADWFARDWLYNHRSDRRAFFALINAVNAIDARRDSGALTPARAKQALYQAFTCTINQQRPHKPRQPHPGLLLGHASAELATALSQLQRDLTAKGHLAVDYRTECWPSIQARLQATLAHYQTLKGIDEDVDSAMVHAAQLMTLLASLAAPSEATDALQFAIRSFAGKAPKAARRGLANATAWLTGETANAAFPVLARLLNDTLQGLLREGVLPIGELTVFQHALHQHLAQIQGVKQQLTAAKQRLTRPG